MQRTTRTLLGACTVGLLLLTAAPLGSAHFTNTYGSQVSAAFGPSIIGAENCRYGDDDAVSSTTVVTLYAQYLAGLRANPDDGLGNCGPASGNWTSGDVGVSGNYVGSSDVFVYSDLFPIFAGPVTFFPGGAAAAGGVSNCDQEVLSLPAARGSPQDESTVDGTFTGGLVLDGTWDDGGIGGACHVNYAGVPDYTTNGCNGYAHANDKLLNGEVFISAECDFEHTTGGSTTDSVLGAVFCGINLATGACTVTEELAIIGGIESGLDPTNPVPETFECGSDGVNDAANYGEGNAEAPGQGVPFPGNGTCPGSAAPVAAVFVHNAVDVEGNLFPLPPDLQIPLIESQLPATTGWIDWSKTCSYGVKLANESVNQPSGEDVRALTGYGEVNSCPADPILDGDNGSTPPICAQAATTSDGGVTKQITHTWPCLPATCTATAPGGAIVTVSQSVAQALTTSVFAKGDKFCNLAKVVIPDVRADTQPNTSPPGPPSTTRGVGIGTGVNPVGVASCQVTGLGVNYGPGLVANGFALCF